MEYLKILAKEPDVRKILHKTFVLSLLKDPLIWGRFDGVTEYLDCDIISKVTKAADNSKI